MAKRRLIDKMRIQMARQKFMRRSGPLKSRFSFEEWLNLFSQLSNSFAGIALMARTVPGKEGKEVVCTGEAVRRLYLRYFASLFPCFPSGRSRRKLYNLNQRALRARDFSEAPELLKEVAEIAKGRGFVVERVLTSNRSFASQSLVINGKRCDVHKTRNVWAASGGKRKYAHLNVYFSRLRKRRFLILIQEVENYPRRVFVIPTSLLLQGWKKGVKSRSLYIPLERYPVYRNHFPKVDVWQYLDAWHLLKKR